MKKIIIRIVSVMLAVICLFSFSGFAFAAEETVTINGTEYEYGGELLIDGNTGINCDPNIDDVQLYSYYILNAPQNGYYSIGYGTPHATVVAILIDESVDDGEENYKFIDFESSSPEDYYIKDIYYLEAGKYFLFTYVSGYPSGVCFRTEYLGADITEYSFKHDMILVSDIHCVDGQFNCDMDAEITFSSGKVLNFCGNTFGYASGDDLVNGENNLTVDFCGNQIETTANIYDISHYVEEVHLSNWEYHLEQMSESGNYPSLIGETVTVNFTDGTTQTVTIEPNNNYVTLPNGKEYYLYFDYSISLFHVSLSIYIDGNMMEEMTYRIQNMPPTSTLFSQFLNNASDTIEEVKEIFAYALDCIDFSNPESLLSAVSYMGVACMLLLNIPADFFTFFIAALM